MARNQAIHRHTHIMDGHLVSLTASLLARLYFRYADGQGCGRLCGPREEGPEARERLRVRRVLTGELPVPRLHPEAQRRRARGARPPLRPRHHLGRRGLPAVQPRGQAARPGVPRRGRGSWLARLQQPRAGHSVPGGLPARPHQGDGRRLPEELADRAVEQRASCVQYLPRVLRGDLARLRAADAPPRFCLRAGAM